MCAALACFAANGAVNAQSSGVAVDTTTQQQLDQLVNIQEHWGPEASTDHLALSLVETARSGGTVTFRLNAPGAPKDKTYTLVSWPVTASGPQQVMTGVTFDTSGTAVCAGTPGKCGDAATPNDPIDNVTQPVPGEPVRLGLISSDGTVKLFARAVPVPIRSVDHGCELQAVLLTPKAEAVLLPASGYSPATKATLDCHSEKEQHAKEIDLNAQGKYSVAFLPYVAGLDHGTLTCTVKTAQCANTVSVPWGKSQ
jgi:hypothetical protein